MKRISIVVGLIIVLVLGVLLLPRFRQSVGAEPVSLTQDNAATPSAAGSPNPTQPFHPHSLRGLTQGQLEDYARAYAAYTQMGPIDSIPFAKIATEHEMREAGLVGLPDENNEYGWVIFKGNMAVTVPGARPGTPKVVPYQILGFDLDRGEPFHTIVSPEGTGLGKLVGDPSLPPPVVIPSHLPMASPLPSSYPIWNPR